MERQYRSHIYQCRICIKWMLKYKCLGMTLTIVFFLIFKNAEFCDQKPSLTSAILNCDDCFKQTWDIVLNNANICRFFVNGGFDMPQVLITVPSSPENENIRNTIRSTWLSTVQNNTSNIRYVFVLGYSQNGSVNAKVKKESIFQKDIVQFSFLDMYDNLTYKSIMGYKWATKFCQKALFVMKADDDVYLNIPELIRRVYKNRYSLQNRMGGLCNSGDKRVSDLSSKWYVSTSEYPYRIYPTFASGFGYITSMNVVQKIVHKSRTVPYFRLEDVYMGFVMKKLGLGCFSLYGIFHTSKLTPNVCNLKNKEFLLLHHVSPDVVRKIWKTSCSVSSIPKHSKINDVIFRLYYHLTIIVGFFSF